MKRFIRSPVTAENHRCKNHMKLGVFTQPGSIAAIQVSSSDVRPSLQADIIADVPGRLRMTEPLTLACPTAR
jgi:hypothetical protein